MARHPGTIIDGDRTLQGTQNITRIRDSGGNLRLNDQPSTDVTTEDLSGLFRAGGLYENSTWYLTTLAGTYSIRNDLVSGNTNNSVLDWSGDISTAFVGLAAGDRFILGLTTSSTNEVVIEASTGAPSASIAATVVEPSNVVIAAATGVPAATIRTVIAGLSTVEISAATGAPSASINPAVVNPSNVVIAAATGTPAANIQVGSRGTDDIVIAASTGAPSASIAATVIDPSNVEISAATGAPSASVRVVAALPPTIKVSASTGELYARVVVISGAAPTDLVSTVGSGYVLIQFVPPEVSRVIIDYEYTLGDENYNLDDDDDIDWVSTGVTIPSILIFNLKNGQKYKVYVRAVYTTGPERPSSALTFTPSGPVVSSGDLDALGPTNTLISAQRRQNVISRRASALYRDIGPQPSVKDTIEDLDAVFSSVENIFITSRDERLFNLDVSANLKPLLFRRLSEDTAIELRERSIEAISRWEPRVNVINSRSFVAVNKRDNGYDVNFVFDVEGFDDPQQYQAFVSRGT